MGKIEANDVRGINLGDEMMCAKCIHMNDRFQEDDVITEDEMGGELLFL